MGKLRDGSVGVSQTMTNAKLLQTRSKYYIRHNFSQGSL